MFKLQEELDSIEKEMRQEKLEAEYGELYREIEKKLKNKRMYKEVDISNRFLKQQKVLVTKLYRKDKKKNISKDFENFIKKAAHALSSYGVHSIAYLIFILPLDNIKIKYTDEKIHVYDEYEDLNVILKIKFNETKQD